MSTQLSYLKIFRTLKQGISISAEAVAGKARKVAKFATVPWLYANIDPSLKDTHSPDLLDNNKRTLDNGKLNDSIPVKPIYIAPRNALVLCHGLYGFDVKGPESIPLLQMHYWRGIREALEKIGAKVVVAKVPSTGGVRERALQLDAVLRTRNAKENVNIIGHSMGGLDARYLITHIKPKEYKVSSLTTVCTPHRGSPFMDWCRDYLSLGYRVDTDQLMRDFATVWRPMGLDRSSKLSGSETASEFISETLDHDHIENFIRQTIYSASSGTELNSNSTAASATSNQFGNIDSNDERLQRFSQFLTEMLSVNASAKESSQLSRLTTASTAEGDYMQRSISLVKMAYRRIMATLDTPAYACLTTDYCNQFFNPATPNDPLVEYLSIGAQMNTDTVAGKASPLAIPHDIIFKAEGPNDGLVSLTSAQWGHYLGTVCADHFDLTNRWRFTNIGKDFISMVSSWSDRCASWIGSKSSHDPPKTEPHKSSLGKTTFDKSSRYKVDNMFFSGKEFDAIEFYLRLGTILYQRGY